MKIYEQHFEQHLEAPLEDVWDFFSSPLNLDKITPPDMSFEILSDLENQKIYPGMFIRYRISPILNIQMNWVTEITQVEPLKYFVDDQIVGPYKIWHHEHHFTKTDAGVLMKDKLYYAIPYGPIGTFANALFVGKQVQSIFEFRKTAILKHF